MSRRSTNFDIIIRYLEKNPQVMKKLQKQMFDVSVTTVKVGDEVATLTAVTQKGGKSLADMGFRLGWLGYRLAAMGRMILRAAVGPIQQMIGTMNKWDQAMETIATGLGLQEAGMGDTGRSAEELIDLLGKMPEVGMAVQTAVAGIAIAFMQIAVDNAPALISILESVRTIVDNLASGFAVGLVDGIASVLSFVADLSGHLGWLAPIMGKIFSVLVILAPAFIGLGSALFFIGPALWLVRSGLFAINWPLTIMIGILLLLITHWEDFKNVVHVVVEAVKAAFRRLGEAVQAIIEKLKPLWDMLSGIGKAISGVGKALGGGGPTGGYGGVPGGTRPGVGYGEYRMENIFYNTYDIGNVSADVDLDRIADAGNRGTGEALAGRNWNNP